MAGRGAGKTFSGAQLVNRWAEDGKGPIALVSRTPGDVRDVMIEGPAGILSCSPPWFRPRYNQSKRRVRWPNGTSAYAFSSYEPQALRGPQHQKFWADDLAAWKYDQETWDMLHFGLRLGDVQGVITTTPRPTKLMKEILSDSATVVTRGTTYDNRANLSPKYYRSVIAKYEGTTLGRQELGAELLEDIDGALWTRSTIDNHRVSSTPDLVLVVVADDPPGSTAECGIVGAGIDADGHLYVIDDRSHRGKPHEWGRSTLVLYDDLEADYVIGEVNQGGDMVESVIRAVEEKMLDRGELKSPVAFKAVHASRGKRARAEPIAALYEQGRVHHVGSFPELEDQMCTWTPFDGPSPDRMDALVWALTVLHYSGSVDYSDMRLSDAGRRAGGSPWSF